MLLLDARDGLNEIEPFAIGPDELALPGVELHVLHHIAEGIGARGKLLAFRRIPPRQEVVEEGIAGKDIVLPDIVLPLLRLLVAPFAQSFGHQNFRAPEFSLPCAVTRQHRGITPVASPV
jgi:hypothetical protein